MRIPTLVFHGPSIVRAVDGRSLSLRNGRPTIYFLNKHEYRYIFEFFLSNIFLNHYAAWGGAGGGATQGSLLRCNSKDHSFTVIHATINLNRIYWERRNRSSFWTVDCSSFLWSICVYQWRQIWGPSIQPHPRPPKTQGQAWVLLTHSRTPLSRDWKMDTVMKIGLDRFSENFEYRQNWLKPV
jgi:hypothetical protein